MLVDIVILPPAGLRQRIGKRIKKEITGHPATFVVDNEKLIPHLSLWHLRMSAKRIPGMAERLKGVVKQQKPVRIVSTRFTALTKEEGIVEFSVKNNRNLSLLQQRVFREVHSLKTGMMPQFKIFGLWRGKTLRDAQRFGRPLSFAPHFTMGLLRDKGDASRVAAAMKKARFHFVAGEIFICEVNRWWQVTRIIKRLAFGKQ